MKEKDFIDKVMGLFIEAAEDDAREKGMSEEDIEIRSAKFNIMKEQAGLENELEKYTHNSYIGITAILNEHHKKVNDLLKDTIEKCKKYLDDNKLPYTEEEEDEEEE